MNKLQESEFHILESVIGICDELKIKYYLVCGSALGAAKYQGFIPWDDDIDIGLFREDYEKFCEIAQSKLPEYYFLQNYKTEEGFPALYSKVRDNRTTYIEKSVENLKIHHGVYIDIFPLDGYPIKKSEIRNLELKKTLLKCCLLCVYDRDYVLSWKAKIIYIIGRILGMHKKVKYLVHCMSILVSRYPIEGSKFICNHGNWQGKLEYALKEQYGEGTWSIFEGLRVRIPEKYDEYLTQKYGDWKAELPKEQQIGHHYYEICDVNTPYTKYLKQR